MLLTRLLLPAAAAEGEAERRGLCVAAAAGGRRLPSTRVALGGRSTSMSLVDRAVARSPYLAAMASCDHGVSAISRAEGVWKFLVGALLSSRLPLDALPLDAMLLDPLLPADDAELADLADLAEVLREKNLTSRSCDEPYPLPLRARPTDPISYSSSTFGVGL